MADAISIEETNKVRLALGLKALPVPGAGPIFKDSDDSDSEEEQGSTLESREAQGYDNWNKLQDEADAKKKRQAKNDAIKKARDVAQRFTKLEGKGLGDEDDGTELDTRAWLRQQKKRQKKLDKERERARKMEQELREREEREYTSKDLAGVKVAHEMGDFDMDGEDHVLTLKDTTIDENEEEGDELENLELRERERLGEKLNLKKKKPVYNPNEVGDDDDNVLLKQYDQVIDGKKRKRFTLDAQGSTAEEVEATRQASKTKVKAEPISLDILNDLPISDYQEPAEVKIKKPKKKKAKTTRQKVYDDDDIPPVVDTTNEVPNEDAMDVDTSFVTAAPRRCENVSFIDDDDLQASLAKQRREALKKRNKMKPEDIARQLREESAATPRGESEEPTEEGGLLIDETSEFVANLQRREPQKARNKPATQSNGAPKPTATPASANEDKDMDMKQSYNEVEDAEELAARAKREESIQEAVKTDTGLEEEATLNHGIGSTLGLLTQRGILKKADSEDLNSLHRDRQRFLAEKQKREAAAELKARQQRERDRASGKLDRMSAREREEYARWENKSRDQAESRQMTEIFNREYKPDVQLKYVDDFGRSMNQKEAFKHLSHQFHGKGSGKQKTEKHLKKIDEEKKKEAQSSLDSGQGTGMNNALGATAKKNKMAGVRLA